MAKIQDPYAELIDRFNQKGVKYVVIGMSGINYYASNSREAFSTMDFDVFIKPVISNVKKAVEVFRELDYSLASKEGEIKDSLIKKIVSEKSTISATDPYGIAFELILTVSGYRFDEMENGASIFLVEKVPVKVAKLHKLLRSKKIAARKKDLIFLKRYKVLVEEKSRERVG